MLAKNRSIPDCSAMAEIPYPDIGDAIDWLCAAFGFTLRLRIADHRAQLNVGNCAVALTEAAQPTRCSMLIRVEDVDHHHRRAIERGAKVVREPADHPYGERQYTAADPAGHVWTFSQTVRDVQPEEWGGTSHRL
ncbi:MAG TPA: VOC family protein [Thermoanaerobaculia bacterium]|nr:VOC family protein [Thermoanaerobaculia bacterium]